VNRRPSTAALIRRALAARERAYAPYSRYRVGAALLCADGSVVEGCNVENASYGLTVCAERVAVFAAVASGRTAFVALAVATSEGAAPCGACRQVLREFAGAADAEGFPIHMADAGGAARTRTLGELLPDGFGPKDLASVRAVPGRAPRPRREARRAGLR